MSGGTDLATVGPTWAPVAEQRVERNEFGQLQGRWVWSLAKAQREALEAAIERGKVLKANRRDPLSGRMLVVVKLSRAGR